MKKVISLGIYILFLASIIYAQDYDWAISSSGKLVDEGTSVCMDSTGNSYIAGSFSSRPFGIGNFSFVNTSTPSYKDSMDMFVAKLDKTGKVVWAIRSEGLGNEKAVDIACDKTGHIVVVGSIKGKKAMFGAKEITNLKKTSSSIFILKVNALGKINWVRNAAQDSPRSVVNGVSTGPDGEVFITGTFTYRGIFGGDKYKSKNGNNPTAFVAKYLHNGELKWLHQIHGKSGGGQRSLQSGEAVFATNDSRFVYVVGWFQGHVKFGDGEILTSNNFRNKDGIPWQRNFFITKYHADDAREVWTTPIGVMKVNNSSPPRIKDIVVDHQGSSFITGHFPGELIFGKNHLKTVLGRHKNSYHYDIFLAKLDQNGKHLWHRRVGGTEDDSSSSITLTNSGVMITGSVSRNVEFGNKVSLLSGGINSMYVAEYDTNGNALWAIGDNGKSLAGINHGKAIATNGKSSIVIGTYLGNQVGFGKIKLKETGSLNIFVARLGEFGSISSKKVVSNTSAQRGDGENGVNLQKDARKNGYKTWKKSGKFYFKADNVVDPISKKLLDGGHELNYRCSSESFFRRKNIEFSKGYSQRVMITCAIVIEPKIILLDEPSPN